MLKIKEAIVVEGRYDKNTLSQLVDTVILETAGFAVFQDRERLALLRRLAETRGLIILTDSDGAGFVIRNYLSGAMDPSLLKHAYIPDLYGKERRKSKRSKEGKLGVEGMSPDTLTQALRRCGATILGEETAPTSPRRAITKADLFRDGLTGTPNAQTRRKALLVRLALPEHLSTNALLTVLNALFSCEEYAAAVAALEEKDE
ncbi:MAG: DUF4093 domain-containing protein [Oscillospiraceae bacterium]|nr:DUF4093 domain-containing protein [Oscillospiraceae bacterium]